MRHLAIYRDRQWLVFCWHSFRLGESIRQIHNDIEDFLQKRSRLWRSCHVRGMRRYSEVKIGAGFRFWVRKHTLRDHALLV
jgi:hypothetical protein